LNIIKVLIQGYACRKENGRWDATSTTVLVQSTDKLILIDPGSDPENLKSRVLSFRQPLPLPIELLYHPGSPGRQEGSSLMNSHDFGDIQVIVRVDDNRM
jgi:hypothetical protein